MITQTYISESGVNVTKDISSRTQTQVCLSGSGRGQHRKHRAARREPTRVQQMISFFCQSPSDLWFSSMSVIVKRVIAAVLLLLFDRSAFRLEPDRTLFFQLCLREGMPRFAEHESAFSQRNCGEPFSLLVSC